MKIRAKKEVSCFWKTFLTDHPDTMLYSDMQSLCPFLAAFCSLSHFCCCKPDYSELYWCCKNGSAVPGPAPLSGAQAQSLSSGGLGQHFLPGSSCDMHMLREYFHVLPTLSLQTVLDRIVVESSAKSEKGDSQEKGEEVGRFKINDSHEVCVERKLTASLITNIDPGDETKPRLFLLEILQFLVIYFCSTLQSSEL